MFINELRFLIPELILIWIVFIVLISSFILGYRYHIIQGRKNFFNPYRILVDMVIVALFFVMLSLINMQTIEASIHYNQLIYDVWSSISKILIIFCTICVMLMLPEYWQNSTRSLFEFIMITLLSVIGSFFFLNAMDLISLFISLELQTICLYVLTAYKNEVLKSIEAGLKYFIWGNLSSQILLLSIALIYCFTGLTNINELHLFCQLTLINETSYYMLSTPIILLFMALTLKLGLAPFHLWALDVYQAAPTITTMFLLTVPKIALITVFTRLFDGIGIFFYNEIYPLAILVIIYSLFISAIGGNETISIRRMLANSSISNASNFILLAVSTTQMSHNILIYFMIIYSISVISIFTGLLGLRRLHSFQLIDSFNELQGLIKFHPFLAIYLAISLFSSSGLPPFLGFFFKLPALIISAQFLEGYDFINYSFF